MLCETCLHSIWQANVDEVHKAKYVAPWHLDREHDDYIDPAMN